MLRISDARTGETVVAAPARRALTRVEARTPGFGTTALRVLLVADVLARALELGGTPVWPVLAGAERVAELRAGAAALGIRPFEDRSDAGPEPARSQVIHVVSRGDRAADGIRLDVAPAGSTTDSGDTVPGDADPGDIDPATLRLALLTRPRSEPVDLTPAALADAGSTLAHWRRSVAGWARQPSRPVPEEVRQELRAAWEDDLDTPAVLDVLRRVETLDGLPDGARFETYAYADRILGLELTREIGSLT
ncbi:hypothetical protein ACKI1I_12105 [Streptomyces turgidiscabies]|uniref:Cysteinyl-tRNA synthetase n=1 Tax=Streptomyces turgidiscabies (strain Car8) TaxID=698760 RepID=L7F2I9_STRT8|nr:MULTISPECIES: hypothetical protein [Streptomyces]ELP65191.1 hypothetical protein STRTUCAR8_01225 [Streptomyces turgidiscabies Car8]MDX3494647.1 hypothetical protein [Streptomyces turgidiscabies]GAQ71254.1 cysteinyl-tRNA synthetase [Streptomyces turgidiscabies]